MTRLQAQQILLNEIVEKDFGRVAIVLEGRDTAGKTGTIREFTHYLPTSKYSVSFSNMPTKWDMDNWLESWERKMPNDNQIVLFDRSWYSRALVQKLNGWCTDEQYNEFMSNVLEWEAKQDVIFIKLWLSISEQEQEYRITKRQTSPLTSWKFSPNDALALSQFDKMSVLKERMMTSLGEWHTIDMNNKAEGHIAIISKAVNILRDDSQLIDKLKYA